MNIRASQAQALSHLAAASSALQPLTSAPSNLVSAATPTKQRARPASAQLRRNAAARGVPDTPGSISPQLPDWDTGDTVGMLMGISHASTSAHDSRRSAAAALMAAEHQEQSSKSRMWQRMRATGVIRPSLPQVEHRASAGLQGSMSHQVSHARAAALLSLLTAGAPAGEDGRSIVSHDLRLTRAEPSLADVEVEAAAERDMARLTCVANGQGHTEEGDVCCVCLEPLQAGRLRALRCGHVMHETCCRGVMHAHARTCRRGQKVMAVLRCPLCRLPTEYTQD